MLKTRPLCTSAEWNLRDKVWGEVEKNSFITLPDKAGHFRLVPWKTVPTWEGLVGSFIVIVLGKDC